MAAPAAVIKKLDESVVNRIAAGEVIQRPSSALKEMLENSLDAGSTQISVVVKEGGNRMLQIQDNGHGIRKADLAILCHRHTTSKLQQFEDLETIGTLGFRGEALCSISFVSHMTVTTMTGDEPHGWRVTYKDSEMEEPGPQPVASVQGTTITVDDLFYNVPARKKALKSAAEEYGRVVDILSRYAVYNAGVGFSCKRQGESRTDLNAPACSSRLDKIRSVYGAPVVRELQPLELLQGPGEVDARAALGPDDGPAFHATGFVSGVNFNNKRTVFILFINGRLVECSGLKRALEALYAGIMPGSKGGPSAGAGSKPWVFLDLQLPPRQVEVNLHPTKREVGFLHQDHIIEAVRAGVEERLLAANMSRTFTQMQLPFAAIPSESVKERKGDSGFMSQGPSKQQSQAYRPDKLVRTDPASQSLEAYLSNPFKAAKAAAVTGSVARRRGTATMGAADLGDLSSDALPHPSNAAMMAGPTSQQNPAYPPSGFSALGVGGPVDPTNTLSELSSVQELLQEVEGAVHQGLLDIFKGHTFVGMADDTWGLLQYETKLYLVDVMRLSRDLFYQQVLRRFEHLPQLRLTPPAPIYDLMLLALDVEEAKGTWQAPSAEDSQGGSREEVASLVVELLQEKADMLSEYLSMGVDQESGCLTSLPMLLDGHRPDPARLPSLLWALARDVNWEDEKECFMGLAQALADFYAVRPLLLPPEAVDTPVDGNQQQDAAQPGHTASHPPVAPGPECEEIPGNDALTIDMEADVAAALAGNDASTGAGSQASGRAQGGEPSEVQHDQQQQRQLNSDPGGRSHVPHPKAGVRSGAAASDAMELDLDGDATPEGAEAGMEASLTGNNGASPAAEAVGATPVEGQAVAAKGGPDRKAIQERDWTIKNVLFPAMRTLLRPGRQRATDGSCVQVASLERLYRIFERC